MLSRNNNSKVVSSVPIATAFAFDVRGDGVKKSSADELCDPLQSQCYIIGTRSCFQLAGSWIVRLKPNLLVCSRSSDAAGDLS